MASSTGPRFSPLIPKRLAKSPGKSAGALRVRCPNSPAMRSATSRRSSTGPAGSQPMVSAKPRGQSAGGATAIKPPEGSFGVSMPRNKDQSCARKAMARGFSASGT